jgi:hypothetical protein
VLDVPVISLGIMVLIQFGGTIWFFSRLATRVDVLEEDRKERKSHTERLVKIETYLEVMQRQQDEQIIRLDKVLENQRQRMGIVTP